MRLLDLEGENGGKPPKTALCTRLMNLLDTMGVTEYQERRRKAVTENLSRLAFVVSDVVVFVWNESFANASYMRRVKQLAHDSTEVNGPQPTTKKCKSIKITLIITYLKREWTVHPVQVLSSFTINAPWMNNLILTNVPRSFLVMRKTARF